jgi:HAD superfamily hydrolase (TIGR01509 family)
MTPPRLVILDIGAPLVTGPSRGPASRIAEGLGLDGAQKRALHAGLMTRPFEAPGEVAAFVSELGIEVDPDHTVREVWEAQCTEARPIDGAAAALEGLRERGVRLALISNIWAPYLHAARACHGAFFDAHVAPELQLFSYREGIAKPAPELFERVLERAGVAPAEAMMVGDSYAEDIAPAAALGLRTTWVLHRPEREAEQLARVLNADAAPPTRAITAIADLPNEIDPRGAPVAPAVS